MEDIKKEKSKCESCLVGFSKEDILGNCTCNSPFGYCKLKSTSKLINNQPETGKKNLKEYFMER